MVHYFTQYQNVSFWVRAEWVYRAQIIDICHSSDLSGPDFEIKVSFLFLEEICWAKLRIILQSSPGRGGGHGHPIR